MKICVLSDTHAHHISDLPPALISIMKKADMVIHLGDYDTVELVRELKKLGNFFGVTGNHDFGKIRAILPKTDIVEVHGKRLGLVHGHGSSLPAGLRYGLRNRFKGEKIDAILYGHTHVTRNRTVNDILYFNPGSACGKFPAYRRSYGVLTVDGTIKAEIFPIISPQQNSGIQLNRSHVIAHHLAAPRRIFYRAISLW
jgi:putative phosphoesterase